VIVVFVIYLQRIYEFFISLNPIFGNLPLCFLHPHHRQVAKKETRRVFKRYRARHALALSRSLFRIRSSTTGATRPVRDHVDTMKERAELLRRKMAVLRGYLREGVEADLAATHLRDIAEAEVELRGIEDHERKS